MNYSDLFLLHILIVFNAMATMEVFTFAKYNVKCTILTFEKLDGK